MMYSLSNIKKSTAIRYCKTGCGCRGVTSVKGYEGSLVNI